MTKFARVVDIAVRSFFMFVVCWLIFSYVFRGFFAILAVSVAVTVVINVVFEFTVGRKYWRRAAPKSDRPRRKFKEVAREAFARAFARDKTKGFVWAGVIILIMSFVVKLNIYYVVFAVMVFGFAALTRFAPVRKCATMQGGEQNGGEVAAADAGTGGEVCGTAAES